MFFYAIIELIEGDNMIDKIIKDLENNLKIKIDKDKIVYYTDGATDSIVFNIDNKYLIKTVDELTYSSQTEFLNFYKDIPQFQNIIHTNKNLQYICFEFKKGNLYRKNRISPEKTIEQVFNIVKQYREYNHPYFGYLYEDEKSWYEFLNDEVKFSDEIIKQSEWYRANRSYKANVIAYTMSIIFNYICRDCI